VCTVPFCDKDDDDCFQCIEYVIIKIVSVFSCYLCFKCYSALQWLDFIPGIFLIHNFLHLLFYFSRWHYKVSAVMKSSINLESVC
jgi:hypothetical protein